jgi:hypothetical protein
MNNRIIILFALLSPAIASGNNIVINEIAWMGQNEATSNEWIELYNPTDKEISLNGWKLRITKTEIILKGSIKANGYYLLERTSDLTVNDKQADLIFKKALNNKGENIVFIDNKGNAVDTINCSKGWFAGDNKIKNTMERIDYSKDGNMKSNWQNSLKEGGSPKEQNAIIEKVEKKEEVNITNKEIPISISTYIIAILMSIFSATIAIAMKLSLKKL